MISRTLDYADGALVTRSLAELRARHLALFASPEYWELGRHLKDVEHAAELPKGAIISAVPEAGGYRILGWAEGPPDSLLIVDGDGVLIGFGKHPGAGIPIDRQYPQGHERDYFVGFAGPSFQLSTAHLFVRQ